VSCGVGHRGGSDPTLLWLWCRPAATAWIGPLAWEPPCAMGEALKSKNTKTKKNWFPWCRLQILSVWAGSASLWLSPGWASGFHEGFHLAACLGASQTPEHVVAGGSCPFPCGGSRAAGLVLCQVLDWNNLALRSLFWEKLRHLLWG